MIIIKNNQPIYVDYDYERELEKIIKEFITSEYRKEFYKLNFQN